MDCTQLEPGDWSLEPTRNAFSLALARRTGAFGRFRPLGPRYLGSRGRLGTLHGLRALDWLWASGGGPFDICRARVRQELLGPVAPGAA